MIVTTFVNTASAIAVHQMHISVLISKLRGFFSMPALSLALILYHNNQFPFLFSRQFNERIIKIHDRKLNAH